MILEHISQYAGLPVVDFLEKGSDESYLRMATRRARRRGEEAPTSANHRERMEEAKKDPGSVAWRLRHAAYSEDFIPYLDRFVEEVDTSRVKALVIGDWGFDDGADQSSADVRDALIEHAAAFPALRSIFLGDVTSEECEISWIQHDDLAPLLAAYPLLENLTVRGVGDTYPGAVALSLHIPRHSALRSLTLQTGGLPGRVVREVVSSDLPALEHLELWLGLDLYGGDATPDDMAPLLSGRAFPNLRTLGLRNSQHTGRWAHTLAEAPVTTQLTSADLSMGTLRDRDVEHLLGSVPKFAHLESLDLHHHYMSEENTERVRAALAEAGVRTDLSELREPDSTDDGEEERYNYHYYPAVGE